MQEIEAPFMLAVKDELGDRFTINVETTYRTTIRFILRQLYNEVHNYRPTMIPSCPSDTDQ